MKHRSVVKALYGSYMYLYFSMILTRKVLNLLIQVEVEKSRVSRRASATWEEDSEIKTLEYVF